MRSNLSRSLNFTVGCIDNLDSYTCLVFLPTCGGEAFDSEREGDRDELFELSVIRV